MSWLGFDQKGRCLPRISARAGAGVGRGMARELAVEFRKQRDAVGEAKLGAGGGERGIFRRRGAVDDEARAGKRLEQGGERGIADPVVRPRDACAQVSAASGLSSSSRSKRPPSSLRVSVALCELKPSAKPPALRADGPRGYGSNPG